MQKLLRNFVLLSVGFVFSSCGSLPKKPQIELCAHNQAHGSVECFDNQSGEFSSYSINETNSWVMMKPDDWGLVILYIDKLRQRTRNKKVKTELYKVKKTSGKLDSYFMRFNNSSIYIDENVYLKGN